MTGGPRFPPPPPPPPYRGPVPPTGNWFTRGGWWFFVHLFTFGFLTAVPMADAAARIRKPWPWMVLAGSIAVGVSSLAIIGNSPKDAQGKTIDGVQSTIGMVLFLVLFVGTFGVLAYMRTQAYPTDGVRSGKYGRYDPAVGAALEARKRRTEARKLAAKDPALARELRIGRPDLPRQYDDGGLVDLNDAPAESLAVTLDLDRAVAGAIVQARQAAGRLGTVDDVFAWTEIPVHLWDRIRDRSIVVG